MNEHSAGDNFPGKFELETMLSEARRKVRDLEDRIARQQAVPTGELQESSAPVGFQRKTRKLRWRIFCDLCEQPDRIAIRYPGGVPSVCDECLQSRASPGAARTAAVARRQEREAKGEPLPADWHEPRREG